MKPTRMFIGALTCVALLSLTMGASPQDPPSIGHCKYELVSVCKTTYSTSVFKFLYTVAGVFGSTQSCSTTCETKTSYVYEGPAGLWVPGIGHVPVKPLLPVDDGGGAQQGPVAYSGSGGAEGAGSSLFPGAIAPSGAGPAVGPLGDLLDMPDTYVQLRYVRGESACYGDPVQPDMETEQIMVSFVALDGTVLPLEAKPVGGSLSRFLGPDFDASLFDGASTGSGTLWKGYEVLAPLSLFMAPTLQWEASGALLDLVDLGTAEDRVLAVDLGPAAEGALLSTLVSATPHAQGSLAIVGSVSIPIVADAWTVLFSEGFPQLSQVADSSGAGVIPFPALTAPELDGLDLKIAVLATDPVTLEPIAASTYVTLMVRDMALCER